MSLPRTPPQSSEAMTSNQESICSICSKIMSTNHECTIITNCNHYFHRSCIEQFLSKTSECPTCKLPCELNNLKNHSTNSFQKPVRGRPRGAMAGRPTTRSQSRNYLQDNQRSLLETSIGDNYEEQVQLPMESFPATPTTSQNANRQNTRNNRRQRNMIDSDQLTNVIENTVTRLLSNLNILPNHLI